MAEVISIWNAVRVERADQHACEVCGMRGRDERGNCLWCWHMLSCWHIAPDAAETADERGVAL